MISIKGMDKARVLLALYNGSEVRGMGIVAAKGTPLTLAECQVLVNEAKRSDAFGKGMIYFDYLFGRVLKVDIGGDDLDPRLYDRDLGEGAAERAILEEFTRPS
jgi:hypothetical protein